MANVIKITKGLNINLKGKAAAQVSAVPASKVYGLVPDAFWGMKPKVVVKEGDEVKAVCEQVASRSEVRLSCCGQGDARRER